MKIRITTMFMLLVGLLGCDSDPETPPQAASPEASPTKTISTERPTSASSQPICLTKAGSDWITIQSGASQWQARMGDHSATLSRNKEKYTLRVGDQSLLAKKKEDGFKVYDSGEQVILKFKRYPDKFKVGQSEDDPQAWTIRPKTGDPSSYKIKRGEEELGKITYYPDDQQLRAKDLEGTVLCRMEASQLSHVPAVAFMTDLSESKQLMVALMLTVIDP